MPLLEILLCLVGVQQLLLAVLAVLYLRRDARDRRRGAGLATLPARLTALEKSVEKIREEIAI